MSALRSLVLMLLLQAAATAVRAAPVTLQVAAASDLALALPEIGQQFKKATGQIVRFSFGSSGLLAHQIEQGAPFDLFFSANIEFVDSAVQAGSCEALSKRLYARGQLVLYTPKGVAPPHTLAELREPRFRKVAIARPEHAPYGRAAKEALVAVGVWQALIPRLVYGENIQQTLTFAESGNAEAALVARSLLTNVTTGALLAIDEELHQPIDQALVVCGHDEARLRASHGFADFVTSQTGRTTLARYGFSLPRPAK